MSQPIDRAALFGSLPPPWPENLLPAIGARFAALGRKIFVLDDDPTGTQSVAGVPVRTSWPAPALAAELADPGPICYLLTNSRSLPLERAQELNAEIGRAIVAACAQAGREAIVVSRSDSTLRGHFPGETDALAAALGGRDGTLLAPAFFDGGRYTVGDIHYVADGEQLVPAAATPFARDAVFGYRSSNLREWVAEKTGGRVAAEEVVTLSIDDLRLGGPERVAERLLALPQGAVCVANAAHPRDLEVVALGVLLAEGQGRRLLLRSAATLVPTLAGLPASPKLDLAQLAPRRAGGGLTVVGSHVPLSTRQLEQLLRLPGIVGHELAVTALQGVGREGAIAEAAAAVWRALAVGQQVVLYTSRELQQGPTPRESLALSQQVSAALVAVVRSLAEAPRYLVAKGGITSSDIATEALGVERAMVRGAIVPGVPLWELGPESRFPGMPYVVFPGNVGGPDTLASVVRMLA